MKKKKGFKVFIYIFIIIILFVIIITLFLINNSQNKNLQDTGALTSEKVFPANTNSNECSDHIDNDGNGYCDYAKKDGYCIDGSIVGDPGCEARDSETGACVPSQEICDGIDNDCNGKIDDKLIDTRTCEYDSAKNIRGEQERKCIDGQWAEWSNCKKK